MNDGRDDIRPAGFLAAVGVVLLVVLGCFGCATSGGEVDEQSEPTADEAEQPSAQQDLQPRLEVGYYGVVVERTVGQGDDDEPTTVQCEFYFHVLDRLPELHINQRGLLPSSMPEEMDEASVEAHFELLACAVPDLVISSEGALKETRAEELAERIEPLVREYYEEHAGEDLASEAVERFSSDRLEANAEWWWELLDGKLVAQADVETVEVGDEQTEQLTAVEGKAVERVEIRRIERGEARNLREQARKLSRGEEPQGSSGGTEDDAEGDDIIQRVVRQNRRPIRHCYERQLQEDPELSGQIMMKWVIGPTGEVVEVSVVESEMESAELEQCLIEQIGEWTFPEPDGGGEVRVNYPFNFSG